MQTNGIQYQTTSDMPDVALMSVNSDNSNNSGNSGSVIVENKYYSWSVPNEEEGVAGGFTNTGWWGADAKVGPVFRWNPSYSDEAVDQYVQAGNDLTPAFTAWQTYINSLPAIEQSGEVASFDSALANERGGGCVTSV